MQVDVINGLQAWKKLRKNWEAVYDGDPEAHYFLSWAWIERRLATGAGQWFVLAVKETKEDSDYVAFFPLKMHTLVNKDGQFRQDIAVAGSPSSDYTGFLCLPQFEGRALPALAEALLDRHWA
ncbi:MAG: GNAT family N-acetyltransferase, partial [Salaquimonas sp.]|nr:GNAT family N-acetyltransferase [Salaquimonas sp.]